MQPVERIGRAFSPWAVALSAPRALPWAGIGARRWRLRPSVLGWVEGKHPGRCAPLGNAGILRCAQNDDVKLTNKGNNRDEEQPTAKARAGWVRVYIPTHVA